ncbi:MAG: LysM peptidoglycan-binding domain-containing protein [Anaerolineae bacterium]|nr:LysM peptidoglycan-binding domain-containing protein [Anaerolineae bacterium]
MKTKHLLPLFALPLLSLTLVLSLAGLPRLSVYAQGGTVVRLVPATGQVAVGESIPVHVVVDNVTNLYRVEVHLTFDPNLVEVIDADGGTEGIQIVLGPFLSVESVTQNLVNATAGRIDFSFGQTTAPPRSGSGTIATITFRGKAVGSSALNFTSVILSDPSGGPIAATTQNGVVNVGGSVVTPTVAPTATPPATPTPTPVPPGTAVLSFVPSPATVVVGQDVQVALRVQNASNLYGVEIHAVHDGGVDATAITPGACVKDAVTQRSVEGNRIDYAASLRAPSTPFSGNCDLAYVTIRGITAGSGYRLSFVSVLLSDSSGRALPVVTQNGVVNVSASPPAGCTDILGYHVVQRGETLYAIGRAYKVRPDAIARCNGITNLSRIHAGTRLAIPNVPWSPVPPGPTARPQFGPGTPPACRYYHTVQAGENLYRISLRYGVSMWTIAQANRLLNLNYIRVGQVLCIP